MFTPWLWKRRKSSKASVDLMVVNKPVPLLKSWPLFVPALLVIALFTIYPLVLAIIDSINHPIDPAVPIGMVIALLISSCIAFVRSKFIRSVSQTVFFLPYITSAVAISIVFASVFDWDFGLMNEITKFLHIGGKKSGYRINWLRGGNTSSALPAMLVFGIWRSLAFSILILTTALLSVPKERLKAASIDSAGSLTQFMRIVLPSIKGTLKYLITIGVIGAVKVFPLALFNNSPVDAMNNGGQTMMMIVFNFAKYGQYPQAGAASVYLIVFATLVTYAMRGIVALTLKFFVLIENKILDFRISYAEEHDKRRYQK